MLQHRKVHTKAQHDPIEGKTTADRRLIRFFTTEEDRQETAATMLSNMWITHTIADTPLAARIFQHVDVLVCPQKKAKWSTCCVPNKTDVSCTSEPRWSHLKQRIPDGCFCSPSAKFSCDVENMGINIMWRWSREVALQVEYAAMEPN